jgi:hypothetical protein
MATLQPGEKSRMYALGGLARGGAFRGGYVSGKVFIAIDGTHQGFGRPDAHTGILLDSLRITDLLDETPNRCAFRVNGYAETTGSEIVITLGTKNSNTRLFAGYVTDTQQIYAAQRPANVQTECSAIDYTWLLSFVKVTTRYSNLSASAILTDLIARYGAASGFTAKHVAPDLPVVNEITFTEEDLGDAITRVMRRIGGYWFADYNLDLHAFLEAEIGSGAPEPLTPAHRSLAQFVYAMDRSQVLTRVHVEGRGSRLLSHVRIGDTMLPLDTVEMFEMASDVYLKAAFQGSEGGAQYLTFTGRLQGGTGSLVGPGIAPPGALAAAPATGTGLGTGRYTYAYTFQTAAGETLPSPLAVVDVGAPLPSPTAAPTLGLIQSATGVDAGTHLWGYTHVSSGGGETLLSPGAGPLNTQQPLTPSGGISATYHYTGGTLTPNYYYAYRVTYLPDGGGETTAAPYGATHALTLTNTKIQLIIGSSGGGGGVQFNIPPGVPRVNIYRSRGAPTSVNANGPFYYVGNADTVPGGIGGSLQASFMDNVPDSSLGTTPLPTANTGLVSNRKVRVVTSASSSPNITGAKIYRTPANASTPYKLVAQVSGANGAVTYDDVITDAALGAEPPVTNTAGTEYRAVALAQIAAGPPGTIARPVYRTAVNGTQLKLAAWIGDNTTTSALDQFTDAQLGANVPTGDTSGLTQTTGQVGAGATALPVANAAAFETGGGWAVIGNGEQVIRYSGHSNTALTGIPATGIGAITAAIVFNSTVTTAPMLTGVPASGDRAIRDKNLTAGDEIYLVVQCDDATRAQALAADLHRGTGVRETWIQDRRLSVTEARARGQATLALHPIDDLRVTYTCRDLRTSAGKTITVNLPAPTNVSGAFTIQQVTIGNFRPRGEQYPTFTVDASNRQFSFEDLLRRTKTKD